MAIYCSAFNRYDNSCSDDSSSPGLGFKGTGSKNSKWYSRLPLPALMIVGPLAGLAYIIFLPLIMLCTIAYMAFGSVVRKRSRKPVLFPNY